MRSVLFVCLGNICRSPAGEAILQKIARDRSLSESVHIESSGMGAWHIGELADVRMRECANRRGLSLESRAQQFERGDFEKFDYILAADRVIFQDLMDLAVVKSKKDKVYIMTHYSRKYAGEDIPDPYFGEGEGFDLALDILEDSCEGLINHLFERV